MCRLSALGFGFDGCLVGLNISVVVCLYSFGITLWVVDLMVWLIVLLYGDVLVVCF